jgi:hypothetical protein
MVRPGVDAIAGGSEFPRHQANSISETPPRSSPPTDDATGCSGHGKNSNGPTHPVPGRRTVTTGWSGTVHELSHRHLAERWEQRRAAIATATGRKPPAPLVLLPVTAVLAEIFCDPKWRRQIAAASYYRQRTFYLHVAHRLGLPSGFATSVHSFGDPLRNWVDQHQAQHCDTYSAAWRLDELFKPQWLHRGH